MYKTIKDKKCNIDADAKYFKMYKHDEDYTL